MRKVKKRVIVDVETDLDTKISVVSVLFPKDQSLNVKDTATILTSALSMLIKSCENTDMSIKSHELIKDIIDQLNDNYINTKSFEDAKGDITMKIKK